MKLKLSLSKSTVLTHDIYAAYSPSKVYPSAGARTAASVPTLLLPPGRFSMKNLLTDLLGEPLCDQAVDDVVRPACGRS